MREQVEDYARYKHYETLLKEYQTILFHKNVACAQRISYNEDLHNVAKLRNKLLIELDFKQNIEFGMSPREINKEFNQHDQRTCLGK